MRKTVLILILVTCITKIFGFAREIILSYFYGISNITDAYIISLTIPDVILSFIGAGITTCFIPVYSNIEIEMGTDSANKFTSNMINYIFIICTLITVFCFIFRLPIIKLFASGFDEETLNIASNFTRINIWSICLACSIYVFTSFLQLKNNYIIPSIIALPCNIFIIISIYLSSKLGIHILSIGILASNLIQVMFLVPFLMKKGYRHKLILDSHDQHLHRLIWMIIPVIIGVSVNQVSLLVDRTIASRIAEGGISVISYIERLIMFIQGIFVVPITAVIYPRMSKMAANKDFDEFKKYLSNAVNAINILIIPIAAGMLIFAEPIIMFLFGRGAFGREAISMTSKVLFFYSIGMAGFGQREIVSRVFYSLQDTKTPMINAAISIFANILLNVILSKYLGLAGLALATSISAILFALLLFLNLHKRIGFIEFRGILLKLVKIILASIGMGLMSRGVYEIILSYTNVYLALIISISLGALIYFILIYIMRIEDVNLIVKTIKGKLHKI